MTPGRHGGVMRRLTLIGLLALAACATGKESLSDGEILTQAPVVLGESKAPAVGAMDPDEARRRLDSAQEAFHRGEYRECLAAVRATRDDIASILSAYETMAAAGSDQKQRIEADIKFHSAILKASHNQVLTHFRYAIAAYLKAHSRLGQLVSADDDKEDLERHHQIALAIATGKAKSAYSLTVEMLHLNRGHFEQGS